MNELSGHLQSVMTKVGAWIGAYIPSDLIQGIKLTDIAIALFALVQLFIYSKQTKVMKGQLDIISRQAEIMMHTLVLQQPSTINVLTAHFSRIGVDRHASIALRLEPQGSFAMRLKHLRVYLDLTKTERFADFRLGPRSFEHKVKQSVRKAALFLIDGAGDLISFFYNQSVKIIPGIPITLYARPQTGLSLGEIKGIIEGTLDLSIDVYITYTVANNKISFSRTFSGRYVLETHCFEIVAKADATTAVELDIPKDKN